MTHWIHDGVSLCGLLWRANKRWHGYSPQPDPIIQSENNSLHSFPRCPSSAPSWQQRLAPLFPSFFYFKFPPVLKINYIPPPRILFFFSRSTPAFNFLWAADVRRLSKRGGGVWCRRCLSEVGPVATLSTRDLEALGREWKKNKYREQREIEVAPAPASEADSWEISG